MSTFPVLHSFQTPNGANIEVTDTEHGGIAVWMNGAVVAMIEQTEGDERVSVRSWASPETNTVVYGGPDEDIVFSKMAGEVETAGDELAEDFLITKEYGL
jgi:hypothetical protein